MNLENRENKFKRITKNRLTKIQDSMLLIESLSYSRFYTYTDKGINEVLNDYEEKGLEIMNSFLLNTLISTSSLNSNFKFSPPTD
ncbi:MULTISPECIES: hypothetical protein [unclassified Enterococcus]|uniref:hypothetical protein n=1 Tax=unclassified Enterococcus TaxID=2608891 RepID=UPI001CE1A6E8|nr:MULTISPECIES: hypothetical protein [unclassified Enterococcus]MCA5014407.1 hypothetical protein [Enterococcus sp. S23]MCA5017480.1 hypothetical protein [Enterococcus sp. S22(2020)]